MNSFDFGPSKFTKHHAKLNLTQSIHSPTSPHSSTILTSLIKKKLKKFKSRKKHSAVSASLQVQTPLAENLLSLSNSKSNSQLFFFDSQPTSPIPNSALSKYRSIFTQSPVESPLRSSSVWSGNCFTNHKSPQKTEKIELNTEVLNKLDVTVERKKSLKGELQIGKISKSSKPLSSLSLKRKMGSIPKRAGGFMSNSFASIKWNEN